MDSTFTIEFLLDDSFVDSITFTPADNTDIFEGIILDTAFDEVVFTETNGGIDNEFFGEMFVARQVPEPGTLSLLASSPFGLGVFGRRQVG